MYTYLICFGKEPGESPGANYFKISLPIKITVGEELRLFIEESILAANCDKEWLKSTIYWNVDSLTHWIKCDSEGATYEETALYVHPSPRNW